MITNHVLAGVVIGRGLSRRPVGAFLAGLVSHVAMDACPHWGSDKTPEGYEQFIKVARCDGCAGLAAMALAAGLAPGSARRSVLAGMAGAAVLDADKPMEYFFGVNPFPAWIQNFHESIQNESKGRLPLEVLVAGGLAVLALGTLRV